ncbi:MAG TPA: type VI secretion system protein TssA [Blastocatellia bacterium]|nr:type VI secretion system protein TssA [Blastocatellia bacterium]
MSNVAPVIDIDSLMTPVSADNPAGAELRYIPVDAKRGIYWHDEIREAARENLFEQTPKYSDWPKVVDLTTRALATLSKDWQIAAWLAEAMVKHDRFDRLAGLRDGAKLMRGLMEQYWDVFYPSIDPEDGDGPFVGRINVISALSDSLSIAVKKIPLTNNQLGLSYSYLQWHESRKFDVPDDPNEYNDKAADLIETANREGKITSKEWRTAETSTSHGHFLDRLELIRECRAELKLFDDAMDDKFQRTDGGRLRRESPGVKKLTQALDEIHDLVAGIEEKKRPPSLSVGGGADNGNGAGTDQGFVITAGAVSSRQEALRRLEEVANYFRVAEPHSPVAFLVQRAVKWGNMDLHGWLDDVIKDQAVLGQLRETLGLQTPGDGAE